MFYIFHGDDAFSIDEAVRDLRRRLIESDPMADLNYAELDGRSLSAAGSQNCARVRSAMAETDRAPSHCRQTKLPRSSSFTR